MSATTEHSVLIALRELDGLEQQRRDDESAAAAAREAAEARARAEAEARARAEIAAQTAARTARDAAEAAERERREHALRLRAAEVEARVRGEQAARLHAVEAEIDAQLRANTRQETVRRRLAMTAVLATLGLVGAVGAMFATRPVAPVVVAAGDDSVAAMQEYADVLEAMKRDVTRLRGENARQNAILDAAATLLESTPPPAQPIAPQVTKPRPRPQKPATDAPTPAKKDRIVICKTDDPLAEDCPDAKTKKPE